jgi:hypothetical protein
MIVIGWRKGRGRGQGLESCLSIGLLHFGVCAVVFFEGKMTAGNVLDMGENWRWVLETIWKLKRVCYAV